MNKLDEWKKEDEAIDFLVANWKEYNNFTNEFGDTRVCPVTKLECDEDRCASWEDACVIQANFPLDVDKKKWTIRRGYCRNPLITGTLTTIKGGG